MILVIIGLFIGGIIGILITSLFAATKIANLNKELYKANIQDKKKGDSV